MVEAEVEEVVGIESRNGSCIAVVHMPQQVVVKVLSAEQAAALLNA